MNDNKQTCGPLFLRCLEIFTKRTSNPVCLFSAGHLTGQAEKIYLGACSAAMARPSAEYRPWVLFVATTLSAVYGLEVSVFQRPEIEDEIWIHSKESVGSISNLNLLLVNSPEWHTLRGLLCGIPEASIDFSFHERGGYKEICDKAEGER